MIGQLWSVYLTFQCIATKYSVSSKAENASLERSSQGEIQVNRVTIIVQLQCQQQDIMIQSTQSSKWSIVQMDGQICITTFNQFGLIIQEIFAQFIQYITSQKNGVDKYSLPLERYFIIQVNLIGIMYQIYSIDWVITIIAWEQFNLSQYQQVGQHGNISIIGNVNNSGSGAIGATIKYFIQSAFTTGFMLQGIVIIYGITGSTSYEVTNMVQKNGNSDQSRWIELIEQLICIPIIFKLGCAPLHNWAPDQYDSLNSVITLWMLIIPKFGVIIFIQSQQQYIPNYITGTIIIPIIAIISLILGSLGQGSQYKFKRFLAYSSIANLGFILLSLPNFSVTYQYTIIYLFTVILLFSIQSILESTTGSTVDFITDFSGQGLSNKFIGLSFSLLLFSLAGFPPLIGFYTKQQIFEKVQGDEAIWIGIQQVQTSQISSFYYQTIIKVSQTIKPSTQYNSYQGMSNGSTTKLYNALTPAFLIPYNFSQFITFSIFCLIIQSGNIIHWQILPI